MRNSESGKKFVQHPEFYLYEASEKVPVRMVNSHEPCRRDRQGNIYLQCAKMPPGDKYDTEPI